ncbi:MAG: hypothetical protein ABR905_22295 [Terracidiphilus sp.]|jgi:hypothetical protein
MVVKSQCSGHRIIGLYIGVNNVRRYFPRSMAAIELHLDHLQIQCRLAPHFWNGQPEIHDSRLCEWLESKQLQGRGSRTAMLMAMVPAGENSFILGPATRNEHSRMRRASGVSSESDFGAEIPLEDSMQPN